VVHAETWFKYPGKSRLRGRCDEAFEVMKTNVRPEVCERKKQMLKSCCGPEFHKIKVNAKCGKSNKSKWMKQLANDMTTEAECARKARADIDCGKLFQFGLQDNSMWDNIRRKEKKWSCSCARKEFQLEDWNDCKKAEKKHGKGGWGSTGVVENYKPQNLWGLYKFGKKSTVVTSPGSASVEVGSEAEPEEHSIWLPLAAFALGALVVRALMVCTALSCCKSTRSSRIDIEFGASLVETTPVRPQRERTAAEVHRTRRHRMTT